MAVAAAETTRFSAPPDWLEKAVGALREAGFEVFAPLEDQGGAIELAPVASADQTASDYLNTRLPLKRLFFPETEVLLTYERQADGEIEVSAETAPPESHRVVLGVRPCDAAALEVLDQVFYWDYEDALYRAKRDRTTVVACACQRPDPTCFCTSLDGSPHGRAGSDALVFATGQGVVVEALTDKGKQLADRLGETLAPAPDAPLPEPPELEPRFDPEKVKAWLADNFDDDFWKTAALRCLGCGACSFLCPTCHCFDITDESTWRRGERRRNWDSCAFALFTRHASGHNPRPDQAARFRQRVMHKFSYFPERFGRVACVGCGRCLRVCGVGHSLLDTLAQIEAMAPQGD